MNFLDQQVGPYKARYYFSALVKTTCGTILAIFALLYGSIFLVDPYSTGHFSPLDRIDIATDEPTRANAGRVRDPRFSAAILGNSRMMRISPHELASMTGIPFASLAVPGVGPAEQLATARAFVRHHPTGSILVWGLGHEWCESRPPSRPFPFWLYEGPMTYAMAIVGAPGDIPRSLGAAYRRLKILADLAPPKAPEDGYEEGHLWWKQETAPDPNMPRPTNGEPEDAPMPAIDDLEAFVSELNPMPRLVLVIPPMFANKIPPSGSPGAVRREACNAAIREALRNTSAVLIDLLQDTSETRNPSNFVDASHYRDTIARSVEKRIAKELGMRGTYGVVNDTAARGDER